jgi:predicted RNA-binding Zn ribbon-like protein
MVLPETLVLGADSPTATSMRLDGGHPALDLVNTVYGQVGGPVEADVLSAPRDLVTFARRVGAAPRGTPAGPVALQAALSLRGALDAVLRACLAGDEPPVRARKTVEDAARAAMHAGRLRRTEDALEWTWPTRDAMSPVHRLAHAALMLLTSEVAMADLRCCEGCCWLFLDRSRGAGRRWCSMADCGTEAKKRRYVQRRRERRAAVRRQVPTS